mgnify:FL=1
MDSYWEWNKENFPWHYDPANTTPDVQYVGRFISEPESLLIDGVNASKKALRDEDAYDEVSIKGEPYNLSLIHI